MYLNHDLIFEILFLCNSRIIIDHFHSRMCYVWWVKLQVSGHENIWLSNKLSLILFEVRDVSCVDSLFELLDELNLLFKINVYQSNKTPAIWKQMKHISNGIFIFFMNKNTQLNVLEYRNVLSIEGNQKYFSFLLWLKMLQTSSILM